MIIKEYDLVNTFIELTSKISNPDVLELGVKRSIPERCTMHKEWVPNYKSYIGTDIEGGTDVDFIADIHTISKEIQNFSVPQKYDIVISGSTFEHILNPFIAAKELFQIMNKDGYIFIVTHNCFPLHAYPCDYWRFTCESLTHILEQAGFEVIDAAYQFPASIHSERDPNTQLYKAYLNISIIGKKK